MGSRHTKKGKNSGDFGPSANRLDPSYSFFSFFGPSTFCLNGDLISFELTFFFFSRIP